MRCTPNYSADPQQGQELCQPGGGGGGKWQPFHPSTALLLSFLPTAQLPPTILGLFWGGHSPALLAVLLGKAPRAAFRVSGGALAKPMLTKDDSGVVMGFGVGCTGAALSCNGKSLHL